MVLILLAAAVLQAQERRRSLGPYTMYEQIIYQAKQERLMTWLSHDMNHGRATGTRDAARVARYIETHFRQYGLEPFCEGSFYQPFPADSASGTVGRNVIGFVPSAVPSDKYVIITAHYDHLGVLDGNIYNGADDNASGVTVLLNLADMFGTMKKTRTGPDKNIIFAALDAKELNMAGSKHFINHLSLGKDSIICAINIDQIGSVLEPVHETDTSFVIVLGEQTLRKESRGLIDMCGLHLRLPPPHLQDHRRPGHHLLPRHEEAHTAHLLSDSNAIGAIHLRTIKLLLFFVIFRAVGFSFRCRLFFFRQV